MINFYNVPLSQGLSHRHYTEISYHQTEIAHVKHLTVYKLVHTWKENITDSVLRSGRLLQHSLCEVWLFTSENISC